ncbi:MAG: peptidoglycan-binding protein [Planctomycetes bacterium]|nr:peptidoglycan-binding protein [Planctomycetota bacterium]
MAHLVAPIPTVDELPCFFNVDAVVGAAPASNLREDVLLVQFAFKVIADSPRPSTRPEVLAAAKAVTVDGVVGPATINAIRVLQQKNKEFNSGTVVDGRVSPAKGTYSFGPALWTIIFLNDAIQDRFLNVWPRIDLIPSCPEELKRMVMRTVVGK